MDPAAADRVAGLHAAVDAAGLSGRADPVTRCHAGALDAALVALLLEHPAAATGDAALLVALKAARRKGGADGFAAAVVLGVAAGGAGATNAKPCPSAVHASSRSLSLQRSAPGSQTLVRHCPTKQLSGLQSLSVVQPPGSVTAASWVQLASAMSAMAKRLNLSFIESRSKSSSRQPS